MSSKPVRVTVTVQIGSDRSESTRVVSAENESSWKDTPTAVIDEAVRDMFEHMLDGMHALRGEA